MPCLLRKLYALPITLLLAGSSWSVSLPPLAKPNGAPNLRRMTHESGYIFAGIVMNVERVASSNSVSIIKITFHVNHGIRGIGNGQTLIIHEWAGLWRSGEFYRRGDRVLLFLYRPSKLGLTSPVGGRLCRFKLDSSGMVILQQERRLSLFADPVIPRTSPVNTHLSITDFARAIHQAEEE